MSASGIVLENVSFAYAGAQAPSVEGFGLSVAAGGMRGACRAFGLRQDHGDAHDERSCPALLRGDPFREGEHRGTGRAFDGVGRHRVCGGERLSGSAQRILLHGHHERGGFRLREPGDAREEVLSRTVGAARATGSLGLLERRIFGLSSGERQRVAIASAYACAPSVFVFDEPSANLDPEATLRLGRVVAQIVQDGHAVVVAEHRLGYLRDVASRVVVMEDGRAVAEILRSDLLGEDAPLRARGIRSVFPERLPVEDNAGDVPGFRARRRAP